MQRTVLHFGERYNTDERMYLKQLTIATFLTITLMPAEGWAQACCSAGTPFLGSLEFPATPERNWRFAFVYDYNTLRDVVSGTKQIFDNTRQRVTHSLMWETSYGITSRFSATVLITAVQQERKIAPETPTESVLRTRGLGDALLLFKYALVPLTLPSQQEVTIGIGGKIPLGVSTLTSRGVLIPADMQPSTGAWDGVLWGYASQGFIPWAPLTLFMTASHRFTGTNERYVTDQRGYKFGNETFLSAGGGYRTDDTMEYLLMVRYRQVEPDLFSGFEIPNTGGVWLSLLPGLNIHIEGGLTVHASVLIPIYRSLNGTQLTTTSAATLSLFYAIGQ